LSRKSGHKKTPDACIKHGLGAMLYDKGFSECFSFFLVIVSFSFSLFPFFKPLTYMFTYSTFPDILLKTISQKRILSLNMTASFTDVTHYSSPGFFGLAGQTTYRSVVNIAIL